MRRLHLEKKGIRGLAIAESFRHDSQKSVLAGVIISSDLVIDGFVLGDVAKMDFSFKAKAKFDIDFAGIHKNNEFKKIIL